MGHYLGLVRLVRFHSCSGTLPDQDLMDLLASLNLGMLHIQPVGTIAIS
jgi:hypothetical protein